MDNKVFQTIAKDVEQTLLDLGDRLTEFTIGKTEKPNDRECFYQNKFYTHFCEICKGTPEIINHYEKELIEYFEKHSTLKEKQANERDGGGGNPNADILYVAIKNKENDINEIDGNILPKDYPLKFN